MQRDKYGQTAQYGWEIDHIEGQRWRRRVEQPADIRTAGRLGALLAYSANANGTWHGLADHVASVSKLAREFLQGWKGAEEAALAGMLHDIGKYGDLFQARMKGDKSGHSSHEAACAEAVTTDDFLKYFRSPQYRLDRWRQR